MSDPFATSTELAAGWRPLTEAEVARADVLLARASRKIRAAKPGIDELITSGGMDAGLVGDVACQMVKRAMQGPTDLDGVTQQQESAGSFSFGTTFANPSGDLYLTKTERRDLRISVQRAASIDLIPSGAHG